MKLYPLLCIIFLLPFGVDAQFQKIKHSTFEITDSTKQIQIDLNRELKTESWPGNTLLLETRIVLENGNRSLYGFLEKSGRYEYLSESKDSTLTLGAKFPEPPLFITPNGSLQEFIQVKVLIPDNFVPRDSTVWIRKPKT